MKELKIAQLKTLAGGGGSCGRDKGGSTPATSTPAPKASTSGCCS